MRTTTRENRKTRKRPHAPRTHRGREADPNVVVCDVEIVGQHARIRSCKRVVVVVVVVVIVVVVVVVVAVVVDDGGSIEIV